MCESGSNKSQPQDPETDFRTNWTTGPRTAAWDELWRRILSDVCGNHETPDSGENVGEVDTGA